MAEIRISATGELKLYDSDDSNYVSFKSAGTVSSDVAWVLPSADGSSGQALTTNGSGTLSWADAGSADPSSADGDTLGTASAEWSDLYLADGGIVYFGNDQDINITHVADTGLTTNGTFTAAGVIYADDATSTSAPVISFTGDTNTGFGRTEADGLAFYIGGSANMRYLDNKGLALVEGAPQTTSLGALTLNQGSNDALIIDLKSSDVAHGMTSLIQTDTYAQIKKYSAGDGGLGIYTYSEGDIALRVQATATGASTTKGDANSCIYFDAWKKSGTDQVAMGSNENLFSVNNNGNTQFIVDAEGDLHVDGSSSLATFDTYEDAHMVRALDLSHGRGVIDSKFDKFIAYNHEKLAELRLVGRDKDDKPNFMVNLTGMQRLHNGAIWQQYEKHQQLLDAVYDLAKEAVGEDKANAILDKHEIKRLQ